MRLRLSKTAEGFGWTSVSTIVNGLTQVLRLSILSRFLTKEDFGVVTIITFVLGLTQVFSDLGFSAAIMSEKELKRDSFNGVYWVQFLFYTLLIVIVILLTPLIAKYYHQPLLRSLIPLSLLELFFMGVGRLYDTLLQKQMRFRIIAIRNVVSAVVSLVVAVVLAFWGLGPYSLVISTVLHAAILQIWNFILGQKDYPLSCRNLNLKESKSLMTVGFYQMGTQIIDYLGSKIDILIISRFLGLEILGIYNLVKELVLKFIMIVNTIVNRVMLPTFSARFTTYEDLKNSFVSFIEKLSLLNIPIIGFVFVFRYYLITVFYGQQYTDATQVFGIMSIWSLFVVLGNPNGMIAIVTKKTNVSFVYTLIRLVLMFVAMFVLGKNSLMSAALTMLLVYFIMFFVNWKLLLDRVLSLSLKEYLGSFIRPFCAITIVSLFCNIIVSHNVFHLSNMVVQFILYAFFYALLVLLYLYCFENQQIDELRSALKKG